MPAGSWIRCGNVGGTNSGGYTFTCTKKLGHSGTEHADTKNIPVTRWKDK